jgi:5-methylcytosine-specific restriction endonuclease McrA
MHGYRARLWRQRARHQNGRARKQYRVAGIVTGVQLYTLWILSEKKCYICGCETFLYEGLNGMKPDKLSFDHKISMGRGGLNNLENIAVCCFKCNSEKSKEEDAL